jgi:NADH-quinone oxidoreductase subunit J
VLAHRERLTPKQSQADRAKQRVREYAESGRHLGPLPAPGVYARHNAVDTPALLPDGTPSELSVNRMLAARGTVRSAPDLADDIKALSAGLDESGEEA